MCDKAKQRELIFWLSPSDSMMSDLFLGEIDDFMIQPCKSEALADTLFLRFEKIGQNIVAMDRCLLSICSGSKSKNVAMYILS